MELLRGITLDSQICKNQRFENVILESLFCAYTGHNETVEIQKIVINKIS